MKIIPLTQGYYAFVSDEDYDRVLAIGPWYANVQRRKDGTISLIYAVRGEWRDGKQVKINMHRFILGLTDPAVKADHINHNGLDNQRPNLRVADNKNNLRNQRRSCNNKSGVKGVVWHKQSKKWRAQISRDGRRITIGMFKDKEAAAQAYAAECKRVYGEFAYID